MKAGRFRVNEETGRWAERGGDKGKVSVPDISEGRLITCAGFTLIELLITMAISVTVMLAMYALYENFVKMSRGQERSAEIQQEARIGMERMVKEIRGVGCYYKVDRIITADSGNLEFEADTDPATNAGPWKIWFYLDTSANILRRKRAEWDTGSSSYPVYGNSEPIVNDISALSFSYFDANGQSTAVAEDIRRVDIDLTARSSVIDPTTGSYDTIKLHSSVFLRCMGMK